MSHHFKGGHERLASLVERKLFKIEFCGFSKIGDRLVNGITLCGGASFWIERDKTSFVCGC